MLQGDMAILYCEQDLDSLIEGGACEQFEDIWYDLKCELDYRRENE